MYPEVIKKMAFSREHRDLLLKLYNKEITRREYDRLVESLYRPSKEACEGSKAYIEKKSTSWNNS